MENKKWKRFGSCLMALAMVLSGTALPASAATPGKDGSAEMNEAYAAHESLMPIGPSFSVATLLEWTPESDPDARYSRASICLTHRKKFYKKQDSSRRNFPVHRRWNYLTSLSLKSL